MTRQLSPSSARWPHERRRFVGFHGLICAPSVAVAALVDWLIGPGAAGTLAAPSPYDGTWITHFMSSTVRIASGFFIGSLIGVEAGEPFYVRETLNVYDPVDLLTQPMNLYS